MRKTIKLVRQLLYFPLEVMPKIGVPYRVARWYLRQIVRIDAPLRARMLGGRYEV